MAHADIVKSVRILDRMVRGDREGWRLGGYLASAQRVLKQALQISGESREAARRVIDYLGRRGYAEFGELLKSLPTSE